MAGGQEDVTEPDTERARARDGRAVHALRVPEMRRGSCEPLALSGTPEGAGSIVDVDLSQLSEVVQVRCSVGVV
jgi:hypothetical protein